MLHVGCGLFHVAGCVSHAGGCMLQGVYYLNFLTKLYELLDTLLLVLRKKPIAFLHWCAYKYQGCHAPASLSPGANSVSIA